jgi:hypothetical protein
LILERLVWYNCIMAILPVPERGQPLDVTYIYQIVKAVNDLSTQASTSVNKYVTVDTPNAGKQSAKTSEARIIGGYVQVTNGVTQTAGSSLPFSYSFPTEFKFAPIVTATPVSTGTASDAGKDVVVILSSITTSSIEGSVKFNLGGVTSIGVNLIAIGIPN